MTWRLGRSIDWRTLVGGVDPGLVRLRLASIAVLAMILAAGTTELVRVTLAPDEPVTVLLFAGVVAMISNLAVNEPDLARQRVTTALMALPALAATTAGTLLAPYRVVAAVVFVLVMVGAVYVRRYGPRGFALGQIAFMTYFFTQFLGARPAQLPWLAVAVLLGLTATLLLRGLVFAEHRTRTLRRLVAAFRARAHAVVGTVDTVLAAGVSADGVDERELERMRRARARLNDVALQVENELEQTTAGRVWPGLENETLALRIFDAELALERLTVAARRLMRAPGDAEVDQRPDAGAVAALRVGLAQLQVALSARSGPEEILTAADDARGAVAGLVALTEPGGSRLQRTAFAVRRVADAVHHAQRDAPARRRPWWSRTPVHDPEHDDLRHATPSPAPPRVTTADPLGADGAVDAGGRTGPGGADDDRGTPSAREGLALSTRQAVQVGVATTLAIVVGELVAPARWYWAVIAAFIVFTGTQSRGDLLSRGWGRVVGTVGGVVAGMGLATLVGGRQVLSLVLVFVCVFLGLYLVRVAPSLFAFSITAVLALVYGLIGQFSVEVLILRVEETALGAAAAVLAAFLVLPKGTRAAFGDAVDNLVDTMDDVLAASIDRLAGRTPAHDPHDRARDMDEAVQTLRQRAHTLAGPTPRRRARSSYQRGLRVLVVTDHYLRALVRLADTVQDPSWAADLDAAAARVRANLDGLRDVLVRGRRRSDGEQVLARSAEPLVDAAEAHAARTTGDPHRRTAMLGVARLLRRIDQAVVGLALDLGAAEDTEESGDGGDGGPAGGQSPSTADSAGAANTRSGS